MLLIVCTLCMSGCGGRGGLESAIKDALIQGDTTQARFDQIAAMIKGDAERYGDYLTADGEIDVEALSKLADEVGSKLRPPMTWNLRAYGAGSLRLTVYFERSGSMVPFDSRGGGGQLKRTVNDMINFFPGDDAGNVSITIVNDSIYPYSGTIEEFLQDRDVYDSTRGVGDAAFTDFGLILESVLGAQHAGEVSVLVTDLIYSPRDTEKVSVEKIFNEEYSLIARVFKRHTGKALLVYRFEGDYNGKYYPYNGAAVNYSGKRPYFVLVIADAKTIDRMAADKRYAQFLNPVGATHSYRFNQGCREMDWKLVADWRDNVGRFRASRDDKNAITNCSGDRETGKLVFTIAVNYDGLLKDDAFLCDPRNYSVTSQNHFDIAVSPIKPTDITGNTRDYLEGATHIITLTGKLETPKDELKITLRNDFPDWVNRYSTGDDTRVGDTNFAVTTFGLERFLRGAFDAFSQGGSNYAEMVVRLSE